MTGITNEQVKSLADVPALAFSFTKQDIVSRVQKDLRDTAGEYTDEISNCFDDLLNQLSQENTLLTTAISRAYQWNANQLSMQVPELIAIDRIATSVGSAKWTLNPVSLDFIDLFDPSAYPKGIPVFYTFYSQTLRLYPSPEIPRTIEISGTFYDTPANEVSDLKPNNNDTNNQVYDGKLKYLFILGTKLLMETNILHSPNSQTTLPAYQDAKQRILHTSQTQNASFETQGYDLFY